MTFFKHLTFVAIITLFFVHPGTAETGKLLTISNGMHKGKHIDAVGAVFTIEGQTASIGTGTYIGGKRIITAGHIFKAVLPKSVPQKSGPVTIDISDRRVFWSNENILDLSVPPSALYHATHITLDARFINTFKDDIQNPSKDDVKCDIAILTLEAPVRNLTEVSIPDVHSILPEEGLLVGYGKGPEPNHKKHSRAQALHGLMDMGEWGILMSNLTGDMEKNPLVNPIKEDTEMKMLLGKDDLASEDTEITRATQGDSGGPLLVVTEDEQVHVIGIMSANSQMFNAFASLVVKTPSGFFRNPNLDALLRASR
jgi:hypothetical protein